MLTYNQKRRLAFKALDKKLLTSKNLKTDSLIVKMSSDMQNFYIAENKTKLSLEKKFYVYALLDPRKPGLFNYVLEGGRVIKFNFEPFYIGKGCNDRIKWHVNNSLNNLPTTYKTRLILKIVKLGLKIVEQKLSSLDIESVSLCKERLLIKAIGRSNLKNGPLTNLTDGGEGTNGMIVTDNIKKARSLGMIAWHASLNKTETLIHNNKISKAHLLRTPKSWEETLIKSRKTYAKNPNIQKIKVIKWEIAVEKKSEELWCNWRNKIKESRASHTPERKAQTANKMMASRNARTPEQKLESMNLQKFSRQFNKWSRLMLGELCTFKKQIMYNFGFNAGEILR